MRNLILMLFLSLTMCMTVSAQVLIQTPPKGVELVQADTVEVQNQNEGLFTRLWGKVKGGGVLLLFGAVVGFFLTKTRGIWVKHFAKKTVIVATEVSEFFDSVAMFGTTVDNSIHDNGDFKENSAKEVLAAGNKVVVEFKDVYISVIPKPTIKPKV